MKRVDKKIELTPEQLKRKRIVMLDSFTNILNDLYYARSVTPECFTSSDHLARFGKIIRSFESLHRDMCYAIDEVSPKQSPDAK